jgi:hypothetical protein
MRYIMKTFSLVVVCVLVIANGCSPTIVPLKGKYHDKPYEITTTEPIDSVWSNLKDIFTSNGLPIKKIDKNKGLIRAKKIPMNPLYTFEDNNGVLERPEAWVVLMKDFNNGKQWKPKVIYGEWSIHVTETQPGNITIKVDPVVICNYYPNSFTKVESPGRSTGKFEELLEDYLKQD